MKIMVIGAVLLAAGPGPGRGGSVEGSGGDGDGGDGGDCTDDVAEPDWDSGGEVPPPPPPPPRPDKLALMIEVRRPEIPWCHVSPCW